MEKYDLCEILIEMDKRDQKYRGINEMSNPFFGVLDSIMKTNNLTVEEYAKLPKDKQLEFGSKARLIADKKPKIPQSIKDSLMGLQIELDNLNTEKLIELVKKDGWPTKNGLKCNEAIGPSIIFRHSQEQYWAEIKKLIDKELEEKRISQGEYNLIDNHLSGRPAFNFKKE